MTDPDAQATLPDPPAPTGTPTTESDHALARYAATLRRPRIVYFSIVAVIVVALGVAVAVAYSRGEANNSVLRTIASAPASLPAAAPAANPLELWRTGDRAAIGAPQVGGTVVVWGRHTVRGLDARTGKQTWAYTRSNRFVCTAAQLDGITVAVFELDGNCDQATALDSGTGARKWDRTFDFDGLPLYGRPTFQTYAVGGYDTLLLVTPGVIYAVDPSSGYNRWTYSHFGCAITGAAVGTGGVLIAQNCSKPRCGGQLKYCGKGPQLLLRNGFDPRDDKSQDNPDRITWNRIGTSAVPVSADGLISAVDLNDKALLQLDAKTGSTVARTPLATVPTSTTQVSATSASDAELIWLVGTLYAIRGGSPAPVWTAVTPGPPSVLANDGPSQTPALDTARITVPSSSGITLLDGNTGQPGQSFTLAAPASGSTVYPLGTGFLIAGPDATVAVS
ncbi:MAG: PQQ-binding-like beta-propeller repeat protein [Jatrophihabitans sp.]